MKILFLQYGNYAVDFERFQQGGAETFREQWASVDYVAKLAGRNEVTVVPICGQEYDRELAHNLRSIGVTYEGLTPTCVSALLDMLSPDRVICRTPHDGFLAETGRRKIPTLPEFADVFVNSGLRQRYRNWRLRRTLSRLRAPCIANHSLNASLSVSQALHWSKDGIVPWDMRIIASDFKAKPSLAPDAVVRIFFAGALKAHKGLGDAIAAVARLKTQNVACRLTVAGAGDWAHWQRVVADAGVEAHVHYAGVLPNNRIVAEMNAHDVVLVPSRHEYPEGLPSTLREGLASRSPVIASDHPAFADRLRDRRDAMIFRAGSPQALAEAVQSLRLEPGLYETLSENALATGSGLKFGMYWDEMWLAFIEDPDSKTGWVEQNCLENLLST